jgi:predicted deacetylase
MSAASLIVSIHDVSPYTLHPAQRLLNEMVRLGVKRLSLLVIPRHRETGRLDQHPSLVGWLRRWQDEGHEIVLHGLTHELPPEAERLAPPGKARSWFFQEIYTAREAEFLSLDRESAWHRVRDGLQSLGAHGLQARGFVAPAWLLNPQVEDALRGAGLLYTTTRTEILHLPSGIRVPTTSCVWSTRAMWRRGSSLLWNALLARRLRGVEPMRVGLHPSDLDSPATWRQVRRIVAAALEDREPATYGQWVAERFP